MLFAARSPVGRTEKENNGAVPSFQRFESLYPAELVAKRKRWSFLTDREPNRCRLQLNGSHLNSIAIECPSDGHTVSQVKHYLFLRHKAVHEPVPIVIESELRTRHVLSAVGRFGNGFVCV